MDVKLKLAEDTAIIGFCARQIEARLTDARVTALDAKLSPAVTKGIYAAQRAVYDAHLHLAELHDLLAAETGAPALRSGGDDKPPPPPPTE